MNNRQIEAINILINTNDEYLSAGTLAKKLNISLRTMQNEIKSLKKLLKDKSFVSLITIPSKGLKLIIIDEDAFKEFINESQLTYKNLSNKEERAIEIISILLASKNPVTPLHLADRMFISKSTLNNDIAIANEILSKYNLVIKNQTNKGLSIIGNEIDIRQCIIKEHIDMFFYLP